MTSAGVITVDVEGRSVNLEAILRRVDAQMRATDQGGLRLTRTVGTTLTAGQQRAADSAIREAQAMARAAVAVGDNARAHDILVRALGNSTGATDRSVAGLAGSIGRLQSGKTIVTEFGDAAKSSLLGIIGPAALVTGGLAALHTGLQATGAAITFKANLDATTFAIRTQLTSLRDSTAVFAEGQAFANRYKLTQQELTEALQTSISVMRVSNAGTTEILNTFARLITLAPDKTISDAARAVRELAAGDVVSIKELFNVSAANAHKMKNEIIAGGDAIQVISKFLDTANIGMQGLEAKATGAAGVIKDMAVAQERFKLALGGEAGGPALGFIEAYKDVLIDITALLSGDTSEVEARTAARSAAQDAYNLALQQGKTDTEALAIAQQVLVDRMGEGSAASLAAGLAAQRHGEQLVGTIPASQQAALAAQAHAGFEAQRRGEMLAGGEAAGTEARMLEQMATATQNAALQTQAASLQTQILNQETVNMANAFIAANPHIDAAGIKAAVLAGAITPAQAEVVALTLKIQGLRAELSAISGGKVGGGGPGLSASSFATSQQFFNKNQREAATAAAEALRQQILMTGTAAQKTALLAGEYKKAVDIYGAGSAQAIKAETALIQARSTGAKGAKGAGAVRLSDQQKLNNSLLADQERFAQQSEQAEAEHGRRLIEIDREFQKRQREQSRANELSKREGELGFLKSITSSELNATKEGRDEIARINAQFYADFAAAQAAAQAGNVKQSEELVEQARKRAQVEQQYAEEIDAARKDKNRDEVARLEALREKERQLLDEQQKQILEGDADVTAKNEALTEEEKRFAEQQEKMGVAVDNKADRTVNAALREGKAVADVNAALLDQEAITNRIGVRGGVPAATAPAGPTTATPGITAAPPASDLGAALGALKEAVAAVERATTAAGDKVAGAVGRLGSTRLSGN